MSTQRDSEREFYLAEHDALQKRMEFARHDLVRTETVIPLAVAVILSWAFTNDRILENSVYRFAVFLIPCLLTVVGGLRYRSRLRLVLRTEDYICQLEDHLRGKGPVGYENFVRRADRPKGYPLLGWSRQLLWGTMFVLTAYLLGEAVWKIVAG